MRSLLFLAALCSAAAQAEGTRRSVDVFYPGKSWYLRYELDGGLEQYNNHKAGVSTYAYAVSADLLVTAQLAPAGGASSAAACRDDEYAKVRRNPDFGKPEVRFSQADGAADMEVVVTVEKGDQRIVSRHLHRYWLRDGVCAKVHASKTPAAEHDRDLLARTVGSARFEQAGPSFERGFLIPGRGTLVLATPADWGFRTTKPAPDAPRDIIFMAPDGDHQLVLTLFPDAGRVLKGEPTPRGFVESAREKLKAQALEAELPLQELAGRGGTGYYVSVTDRNLVGKPPQRENWKHLKQGALPVGKSLLFFSLFSNANEGTGVEAGMRAVAQAAFDAAR